MPKPKRQIMEITEKPEEEREDHGEILISWQFPEHPKHERTKNWKIWMGILGGSLLLFSLITFNWLFAVVIIMVIIISILRARHEGQDIIFNITEDGLELGSRFYEYRGIKSFWIIYEPPEVKTLYFKFKSSWRPDLRIPLEDQNPLLARDILLEYLEEDLEKEDEPFSDALGRMLKL